LKKFRKMMDWIISITIIAAALYMGIGIWRILKEGPLTSFPWYTACYFTARYFGPVLLLEAAVVILIDFYWGRRKGS